MYPNNHKSPIKPSFHSLFLKPKFLTLFAMASLLFLTTFSLLLFFSLTSATHGHRHFTHKHHTPPPPSSSSLSAPAHQINQACKATRDPQTCETTLTQPPNLPPNPTPLQIIQRAMLPSLQNLKTAQSEVQTILDGASGNPNTTNAAKNCLEVLGYSEYRLNLTGEALPGGRTKDARAWASAALLFQYDCWSGLKYVNDTQLVNKTMADMNYLIGLNSNALSMMVSYDLFGDNLDSWKPPQTERDGFWEKSSISGADAGFKGGFPSTPDITVCKEEGKGCVKTVQEAVDKAPDNGWDKKFVIKINQGVYNEIVRVPLEKRNVVFLGDGMGKTVITGSLTVGPPGISTGNTATVGVVGDGFMARDITFENTAGPETHQAVAFRSDSDLSVVENCEFLGNQDTLYARSLRQFYKSCRIEGNVDFIFGNAAAVFQDSEILIRPRQQNPSKGEKNAVTAHGRTDPAQSTGFVFQNCLINGTQGYMALYYSNPKVHKNFLGRPWKEYSRTVFVHCNLEALVTPDGWLPWSADFALSTLYYGEYENSGPGANVSSRVSWSSQVPKEHVLVYSVENFIQGNEWINNS